MKYYIGADLGTSSLKLLLVNKNGEILNSVSKSYDVIYPKNGWSEQNPYDWWNAFVEGTKELIMDVNGDDIAAIGVSGQMHGLVVLDECGEVIRNTILWNDSRTQNAVNYLNNVIGKEKLSKYTANIAFAGFTAPKFLWLKENEPENFKKISKFMLPKDYINYRLTGVHATDYSDAAGTLLLDVKNKCWSKEMLDICSVKDEWCPKLYESYEIVGTVKEDVAKILGIGKNTMVIAGAADNAGAAIGTGTFGDGRCNISIGTSGTVLVTSQNFPSAEGNELHAFSHSDAGFYLMGCMLSAASCNKWFCENVLLTDDYGKESEKIDESLLGKNSVFFLPYLTGERSPINDTDASGVFIGLTPTTTKSEMLLAIFEGVAFAIRDSIEVAKSIGVNISKSKICGGGAKSPLWRKIFANVLNLELEIPNVEEGPSFGAAILCMIASGEYKSLYECAEKLIKCKNTIQPDQTLSSLYEERYEKFKKIYPAIKNLYKELKK